MVRTLVGVFLLLQLSDIGIITNHSDWLPRIITKKLLPRLNIILIAIAIDLTQLTRPAAFIPQFVNRLFALTGHQIKNTRHWTAFNFIN